MSIALPVIPQSQQTITFTSSAVENTPSFNGGRQRIARLGDRFKIDVTCRALSYTQAATVVAKLLRGSNQTVLAPVAQPGLTIGTPGSPVIATAATGGSTITVSGFSASYKVREGQYFSIVHNGKRYLHIAAEEKTFAGTSTLSIFPALRSAVSSGDVLEFGQPYLEGFLPVTQNWSVGLAQTVGLTYSVEESL
jgi:hypothetical protein